MKTITTPGFQPCDHFDWPWLLEYLDGLDRQNEFGRNDNEPTEMRLSMAGTWDSHDRPTEDNYRFYQLSNDKKLLDIQGLGDLPVNVEHHRTILSSSLHRLLFQRVAEHQEFVGKVRSCNECATDFGIGATYVEGAGQVLTMTAWRDFGGPRLKGEDELRAARLWKWESHRFGWTHDSRDPKSTGYIRRMAGCLRWHCPDRGGCLVAYRGRQEECRRRAQEEDVDEG